MKCTLATENPHKIAELSSLLSPLSLSFEPLNQPLNTQENAPHFFGNAYLKATDCMHAMGLPSLADDSGLCVPALGGMPGVRSARFSSDMHHKTPQNQRHALPFDANTETNEANRLALLSAMNGHEDRAAFFITSLVFIHPHCPLDPLIVSGTLQGSIAHACKGAEGFGYDALFIPQGQSLTLSELGQAYKDAHSHRASAVHRLMQALPAYCHERGLWLAAQ